MAVTSRPRRVHRRRRPSVAGVSTGPRSFSATPRPTSTRPRRSSTRSPRRRRRFPRPPSRGRDRSGRGVGRQAARAASLGRCGRLRDHQGLPSFDLVHRRGGDRAQSRGVGHPGAVRAGHRSPAAVLYPASRRPVGPDRSSARADRRHATHRRQRRNAARRGLAVPGAAAVRTRAQPSLLRSRGGHQRPLCRPPLLCRPLRRKRAPAGRALRLRQVLAAACRSAAGNGQGTRHVHARALPAGAESDCGCGQRAGGRR